MVIEISAVSGNVASQEYVENVISGCKDEQVSSAICWNTMACSCKYWLISFRYLSIVLTCSAVGTVVERLLVEEHYG